MSDGPATADERLVGVCGFLLDFLERGAWQPETQLEALVLGTLARGRGTFETIMGLVLADRPLQAAMLSRSLFEDMIVAHWLVLHDSDSDWLVRRFYEHADAMRLHEHRVRSEMGLLQPNASISDLEPHRDYLRAEYGPFAEKDWWGKDMTGQRVSMPEVVRRLAASSRFQPRLRGESPILESYYALQQKLWTQSLHHTAVGTDAEQGSADGFPLPKAPANAFLVLFANYWVFGQLVYVALELGTELETQAHFDKQFVSGLAVFLSEFGVEEETISDLMDALDRHHRDEV